MFLSPLLFALHAVLTGVSMALMSALGVKLGFGFSAGLLDYVLNYGKATHPLLLLPVGAAYALVYYGVFSFVIRRFDLPTPGREVVTGQPLAGDAVPAGERGSAFARALGGASNLSSVNACTTRLRIVVRDQSLVDDAVLKALGARGVLRPSPTALQVVLGPVADTVAVEIRDALALPDAPRPPTGPVPVAVQLAAGLATALGGQDNIAEASRHPGRLRVRLHRGDRASVSSLAELGVRLAASPAPDLLHLLAGEDVLDRLLIA